MKIDIKPAWQARGNGYVEITVNAVDGEPMLPPNTTVIPPPDEDRQGFYLTVVNQDWQYFPIPGNEVTFEEYKSGVFNRFYTWSIGYLEQPFEYKGIKYPCTQEHLDRLVDAISSANITKENPLVYTNPIDNEEVRLSDRDSIVNLMCEQMSYSRKLKDETLVILKSIEEANDVETLDAIVFPE